MGRNKPVVVMNARITFINSKVLTDLTLKTHESPQAYTPLIKYDSGKQLETSNRVKLHTSVYNFQLGCLYDQTIKSHISTFIRKALMEHPGATAIIEFKGKSFKYLSLTKWDELLSAEEFINRI